MAAELDTKKIFEVLLESLKDAYKELLDLGLKISGIVIIVLGWFVSQANPLKFLCGGPSLVVLALLLILLGFGLVCFLLFLIYGRALEAHDQLLARGFDPVLFARYRITKSMLAGGIAAQCLLLGGVFGYVFFQYGLQMAKTCG